MFCPHMALLRENLIDYIRSQIRDKDVADWPAPATLKQTMYGMIMEEEYLPGIPIPARQFLLDEMMPTIYSGTGADRKAYVMMPEVIQVMAGPSYLVQEDGTQEPFDIEEPVEVKAPVKRKRAVKPKAVE